MKRRLTLAIGCLACAMPSMASALAPRVARSSEIANSVQNSQDSQNSQKPPLSLAEAAQLVQRELSARDLAEAHSVVSVIFLQAAAPHRSHESYTPYGTHEAPTGHYDVRIHPPARLDDATWLRGFTVAADGTLSPCTTFRTSDPLSTPPNSEPPRDSGLGSDPRQG